MVAGATPFKTGERRTHKMTDTETILKAVLTADGERRARALKVLETGTADTLPEPLLTIRQVCERLQVSRATLWRWDLPCVRRGGVRRYRWGDVLTAMDKTAGRPAAEEARE